MQVFADSAIPLFLQNPSALTIGSFDGVHRGHVSLLECARSFLPENGSLIVYTFVNHPTHVLSHLHPTPFIYTLEHKLKILEAHRVDYTILSTFTKEFAQTPFDTFLEHLKNRLQFTHLVLGKGARFGKDKEGDETHVKLCGRQLGFTAEYMPKLSIDHEIISSGHIRALIAKAEFAEVERCLGRPYSIYAPLSFNHAHYMQLSHHCLPPSATYPVRCAINDHVYHGTAHVNQPGQLIHIELIDAPLFYQATLAELFF